MSASRSVAFPDLGAASVISLPFPIPALLTLKAAGEMGASGGELSPARAAFLNKIGVERSRFVSLHQVHSRSVVLGGSESYGAEADGMVTSDRRLCFGVTVADCMPIYLYDRASGAFGLLHSGWRGTGIVSDAIRLMAAHFETNAAELTVMIGPAIGSCCYRVDQDRAALFRSRWGEAAAESRGGEWFLDLRRANLDLLARLGVGQIIDAHVCTACNTAFSSFRREGAESYAGMLAVTGRLTVPAEATLISNA
jgi:polyphenol oxidase